ncbi:MAG TPA: GMC family oxidoreductase N-terminal domain-containing protein [Solirubrobacteraceae bacterium]|nr:GMC family oxidoreductase N-terminal domain-containing protein [Solirubrobacteraceae bacterium]
MAEADYIVVGAGSAGCVLAARLSEDPSVRVTLVEAGGRDRSINIKIPAAFPNQFHTKLDWDYQTEPEPGANGRRLYVPRGKSLGGSSSMNAMLYVRGRPLDYDLWVKAGAEGWGWADVLPYFMRSEDNSRGASEFHGAGGPVRVTEQRSPRSYDRLLLDAFQAAGIPYTADYNGPEQDGVSMFQVFQRAGRRWSTADAYLRPALDRPNLEVVTRAQVLGLELEGTRVTGVRLGGRRGRTLRAEREVILSAGAINSPQLLMLAGIGHPDELRALGIQARHPLPGVGKNLQDHPFLTMLWEVDHPDTMVDATHPRHLLEWALRRTGKLSSTAAEVCAFVRTRAGLPAADIQFHAGALYFEDHGAQEHDAPAMTIAPTLVAPASRGEVTLRSADPTAAPKILTNSLTEPEDVASMVAGMELAREIAAAEPVRSTVRRELKPGPDVIGREELEAALRERVELIYHPVGTCRMGASSDEGAVCDPELRVRGLDGLRVVDASVMPVIPGGNTNAPTIMVAERAADLIRGRLPPPAAA